MSLPGIAGLTSEPGTLTLPADSRPSRGSCRETGTIRTRIFPLWRRALCQLSYVLKNDESPHSGGLVWSLSTLLGP